MKDIHVIEGDLLCGDAKFAVVVGRFNGFITERLLDAAVDTLRRHGAGDDQIAVVRVPGAYELPPTVKRLAASSKYDAIIALGCVIRGATPHFDYVAGECASGLARIAVDYGVPVGFGVLTVDSVEQAIERAGTKSGNKGADAALAALEMANLFKKLQE